MNANEPAFPTDATVMANAGMGVTFPTTKIKCEGLTKRELIAAMIAKGLASSEQWSQNFDDNEKYLDAVMNVAVKAADSLLKKLETTQPK